MICLEGPPGAGKGALVGRLIEEHPSVAVSSYRPHGAVGERCTLLRQLRILVDRSQEVAKGEAAVMVGSPASDIACHARLSPLLPVERELYEEWARALTDGLPDTRHLLVATTPARCFQEVVSRGRREQAGHTYRGLQDLHRAYAERFAEAVELPEYAGDTAVLSHEAVQTLWRACGTS